MNKLYKEKRFENFRELIINSKRAYKNKTAFKRNENGKIKNISYSKLYNYYYAFCNILLRYSLKNEYIAICGKNSLQWVLSYLCASTVGASVPLDRELSGEDIENFLNISSCKAICLDDEIINKLPKSILETIRIIKFSDILSLCDKETNININIINEIEINKNKMQILLFTSGTTGFSKGVCHSQYAICTNIYQTVQVVKIKSKDTTLSILPLHHTYECTLNCLLILSKGGSITYCEGLRKIQNNITFYKPTLLVVVPALLKALSKRIKDSIIKKLPNKYKSIYNNYPLHEALSKTPFILRQIIKHKVHKSLGGRLRLFIVGAAKTDYELIMDFMSLGIRTLQGYGLTEASPLLVGNNDFYLNPKSTGVAMPMVSIKIDNPDSHGVGEILAKGENIMLGYFSDVEKTNEVFRDGWFCTGDLGKLDDDGSLYICGRIKNVIVSENGKNIYPEELEIRLSAHPEISEVLVCKADDGMKQDSIKAKIFPNIEFIKKVVGRIPTELEIKQIIKKIIDNVNKQMPKYKRISIVNILTKPFEKTTTQKIKRYGNNLSM